MNGKNPRRGIALLFVVSLIVLFFLFATTFVAMSSSYMRTTRQRVRSARLTQYKPNFIMDDTLMMILRDVSEDLPFHPLKYHSLLGDQYDYQLSGFGSFVSVSNGVTALANYGNSVVAIECSDPTLNVDSTAPVDATAGFHKDAFLGRWLTFLDGPCRNLTFPIVDYHATDDAAATPGRFYVVLQPSERQWVTTPANLAAMAGQRFVINGRPFDGFDVTSGGGGVVHRMKNEPFDYIEEVQGAPAFLNRSLQNNRNLFLARNAPGGPYPIERQIIPSFHRYDSEFGNVANQMLAEVGGSGSMTYASVMQLARTALRPTPWDNPNFNGSNENWNFYGPGLGTTGNDYGNPNRYRHSGLLGGAGVSFDPRLATHWAHYFALLGNDPTALGALGLPPNALMDVDNDGDGIKDSIWLDLGLAPIVMPDGTRVKPLVAIQIEDMDGRVNLNTTGTLGQVGQQPNLGVMANVNIPYGQGYGPAEVLLQPLGISLVDLLVAKYGGDFAAGIPGGPDATFNAPRTNALVHANLMGIPETTPGFDPIANLGSALIGGSFGTPSDYHAQFIVGADTNPANIQANSNPVSTVYSLPFLPHHRLAGAAMFPKIAALGRAVQQFTDNPYDFDVFKGSLGSQSVATSGFGIDDLDMKLTPEFLEALLRLNDSDFNHLARAVSDQAPGTTQDQAAGRRLRGEKLAAFGLSGVVNGGLVAQLAANNAQRKVTTESYEVPAIPFNVVQMLREVVTLRMNIEGNTAVQNAQALDLHMMLMLGPELVSGLPLDLNRPVGNGRDDNGNSVFDEPGEPQAYEYRGFNVAPGVDGLAADQDQFALDMNNNGIPSTGETEDGVRQALARNLYMLMLTLYDKYPNLTAADLLNTSHANYPEALKFRVAVAQWAINVVDFRDPDSICTPFEFDIDPFNGWDSDGNLLTSLQDGSSIEFEGRVWGLERPELLLTESRADHQHRSSPTTSSPGSAHRQAHLPNPSAFFEIYNPWLLPSNVGEPIGPASVAAPLHQQINSDLGIGAQYPDPVGGPHAQQAVHLSKVTPGGHPVFRVLIVKDDSRGANADRDISSFDALMKDHVDAGGNGVTFDVADVERTVFFTNPSALMNYLSSYTPPSVTYPATESPVQMTVGSVQHFPYYDAAGYNNQYMLHPGHHAIVGSAGAHDGTDFRTIFGRAPSWTTNTDLDPAAGHLLNRPYIRLNPQRPVELGSFDANGNPQNVVTLPNSISVPLNVAFQGTVETTPYNWSNFAVSGPLLDYARDASGVPTDSAGNPAVPELDGWKFETAGAYANPFSATQDTDWRGYGYNSADENNYNRQVVLQRLANPLLPFHPLTNPYLTLDDLDMQITASGGLGEDPALTAFIRDGRYAVQRGEAPTSTTPKYGFDTTPPAPQQLYPTTNPSTNNVWLRTVDGKWNAATFPIDSFANIPADVFTNTANSWADVTTAYQGTAAMNPITFNNRPYISEAELELVPIQSNSLLLEHIAWTDNSAGQAYDNNFNFYRDPVANLEPTQFENLEGPNYPDRIPTYLPNFLAVQTGVSTLFSGTSTTVSRRFTQVFDFLTVPSRFVGTRQLLEPAVFAGKGLVPGDPTLLQVPLNPPYNWLSNRREPGKINLNTVNWLEVYKALMGSGPASGGTPSAYEQTFPFVNTIQPLLGYLGRITRQLPANRQLMFTSQANPLINEDGQNTLWGQQDPTTTSSRSLLDLETNNAPYDTRTNPYYRNLGRQRLFNMTTERSSVFAVRLTVGYFRLETMPIPVVDNPGQTYDNTTFSNSVWRETIGQEYGLESGTNKRNRAFYLIDRSIPVGFVPGENLNTEKTILLKRYLQ